MKSLFQRTIHGFKPADPTASAWTSAIPLGAFVNMERPTKSRSSAHNRLWWAMMTIIADNLPGSHSAENVCEVVKIRCGHVTRIGTPKGIVEIPKSISFAAMKNDEWQDFWDRAVKCICTEILPGLGSEALEAEVLEMLQDRR